MISYTMEERAVVPGKRKETEGYGSPWSTAFGGFLLSWTHTNNSKCDRATKNLRRDLQNLDNTEGVIDAGQKTVDELNGELRVKNQGIVAATTTGNAARNELMAFFQELLEEYAKYSSSPFKRTEDLVADIKNLRAQVLALKQERDPFTEKGMLEWAYKTTEMRQLEDQAVEQQTKIMALKRDISVLLGKIREASNNLEGEKNARFLGFLQASVNSYTAYTGDDAKSLNGSMLIAAAHTITEAAAATPEQARITTVEEEKTVEEEMSAHQEHGSA